MAVTKVTMRKSSMGRSTCYTRTWCFDAFDWQKREARLRRMTRMLVRRHRARIERVAEALLAEEN